MSQRIYFWHHNLLKIIFFFEKWQKKKWGEGQQIFERPTKSNFELKMLKLHENHKTHD